MGPRANHVQTKPKRANLNLWPKGTRCCRHSEQGFAGANLSRAFLAIWGVREKESVHALVCVCVCARARVRGVVCVCVCVCVRVSVRACLGTCVSACLAACAHITITFPVSSLRVTPHASGLMG